MYMVSAFSLAHQATDFPATTSGQYYRSVATSSCPVLFLGVLGAGTVAPTKEQVAATVCRAQCNNPSMHLQGVFSR